MVENVFTYYWKVVDIQEKPNFRTELRIYGINDRDENVCVRVEDCKTRFIIEFKDYDYLENNFSRIKAKLCEYIFNRKDQNSIKIVYKKKLYGNTVDLIPYIEVYFSSIISMYSLRKKINNGDIKFPCEVKFHEIPATTDLQFMVERDIQPSGWIKIMNPFQIQKEYKETTCANEYLVTKNQIKPNLEKHDPVNVKIMAWDIEAKCKNIGSNPGSDVNDCVFQISCVFFSNLTKIIRKVLLTLGECRSFADDVDVYKFKTEKDLILGFVDLIKEEQPNVLTGWNIFTFDITFMINRAEHNMCLGDLLAYGFVPDSGEVKNVKWTSKAFSTTDIKYIDVEGILSIDLIEVVRKEYKLDSYSLNAVSKHFLKEEKDDISFKDLMYAYDCFLKKSDNLEEEFTKTGKYCVQDSKLVIDLFNHLQTWLSLTEMSKTTSTQVMSVHLNGQQKKFYNQVFRYCYNHNIVVESNAYKSKSTDRYAGAYVFDPIPGLYNYVVPLDFASLYPSIMIAYNLDYTTKVDDDSDLPEDTLHVMEWEDHVGCEHDPLVIQKNTLVQLLEKTTDKNTKKELIKQKAAVTKKISKSKMCQKNKFRFLKQEIYGKGVLPTIIQNLLDARKEVRKEMKSIKDPVQLAIMNQRQLSYKISANSMYGATGVREGALPFMPIAMCVTYCGRTSIIKASNIIRSLNGKIVYGDTDSNYVTFDHIEGSHEEKCEKIWDLALSVADQISVNYPKPMKIEFEETIYYKFMILTKKRYMYYACKRNGEISSKIGQKGVLLARRDNSKFMKIVYEQTVKNVFDGKSKDEVMDDIFGNIFDLLTLKTSTDVLKITKSVNDYNECDFRFDEKSDKFKVGNYTVRKPKEELGDDEMKNWCISNLPAQVQLEIKMINRGQEKSEGSRIEYIILDKIGASKQCDKIENYKYYLENKSVFKIDYDYYILKLIDPIEQIFESIYKTDKYVESNIKMFINKNKNVKQIKYLFQPKLVW